MKIAKQPLYLLIFVLAIFTIAGCNDTDSDLQEIRIGWQIPLATQGQIVQVLKNTEILKRHGFNAEFIPFSFGSPQVEAARSGSLDIIFVGDQPALNLIAGGAPWKLTSVLFETRVALMVPPKSSLSSQRLSGARIASPFGSVAHREAILLEERLGLESSDVKNINLDILEIGSMVQSGKDWPNVDAVVVWEPSVTLFSERGLARPIIEVKTLGVVAMSSEFLEQPDNAEHFQAVIKEAWTFYLANIEKVNSWYIEDSGLGYTQEFLLNALKIDRNGSLSDRRKVDLKFSGADRNTLAKGIQWAFDQGYIKSKVDVDAIIAE